MAAVKNLIFDLGNEYSSIFILNDINVLAGEGIKRTKNIFSPSRIATTFGFIKEPSCFHEYSISRPGRYSDSDLSQELGAIRSLRSF